MSDAHDRGVELIRRGLYCGKRKEMESAVLSVVQGLALIEPQRDVRLTLCAFHNLALFLSQLGTLVLARAVVQRAKPLYQRVGDPVMIARAVWLEGTIARLAGNRDLARAKLSEARQELARLDLRLAEMVREEIAQIDGDRADERAA